MDTEVTIIDKEDENRKLRRNIIIWETVGFVVIFGLGNLFSFIYEWAPWKGYSWFVPINESMWEQSKIAFWPALLFYIIQYFVLRKKNSKSLVAGAVSLFVGILAMHAFYYTIEGAFGIGGLGLSIGAFLFAIILQQVSHYAIINVKSEIAKSNRLVLDLISLVSIVLLMAMIIVFTYIQPSLPIFYDFTNDLYGFITV